MNLRITSYYNAQHMNLVSVFTTESEFVYQLNLVTDALIHSCSNHKLRYYYVPDILPTGPHDYKDE